MAVPGAPPGVYATGTCDASGISHPGNGNGGMECLDRIAHKEAEKLGSTLKDKVNELRRRKEDFSNAYESYDDANPTTEELDLASAEELVEMELNSPYSLPYILLYIFGFIFGRKATISFEDSKKSFEINVDRLAVEEL